MNQPSRAELMTGGSSSTGFAELIATLAARSSLGRRAVTELGERVRENEVQEVLRRVAKLAADEEPEAVRRQVRKGGDWRRRAGCRDADPELFFPVGSTGPAEAQVLAAKEICSLCPVRAQCLQWALDTAQDAGVWGGLSEEERRALRRGQRRRVRLA